MFGQFDWSDVLSLLSTLKELRELSLVSLDESSGVPGIPVPGLPGEVPAATFDGYSSPSIPLSPSGSSNDGFAQVPADILRLVHPHINSLTIGGVPRALSQLIVQMPALRNVYFVCPFKVTHLDLAQSPSLSSLAFDQPPSFTSPSTLINVPSLTPAPEWSSKGNWFQVQKIDFHAAMLKELWFHSFKFQAQMSFLAPNLAHLDLRNVGKYQTYDDGASLRHVAYLIRSCAFLFLLFRSCYCSVSSRALETLHIDLTESTGFDVNLLDSDTLNLYELVLEDVVLGNRSTAERRRGVDDVALQIIQKKSVPLFLLRSLQEQFPALRKLHLKFFPVNLFLTSMGTLAHEKVMSLTLENLPLDHVEMPNLRSFSCVSDLIDFSWLFVNRFNSLRVASFRYGLQLLDRTSLLDSLNNHLKFQFLERLSLYAGVSAPGMQYKELSIPTLKGLDLNLPTLPQVVTCPKLKFLRLGTKAQNAFRFLAANLQILPELDELDIFCAVSDKSDRNMEEPVGGDDDLAGARKNLCVSQLQTRCSF